MASHRRLNRSLCTLGVLTLGCLLTLLATPLQAQQIQVTAADPPAAEQGTVNLNVSIKGKGFKNGAIAKFVLSGTDDPDGIAVNSTTFVSSTELRANINVADTATITKFDIVVKNKDGRIGKGTEMFAVLAKGSGPKAACPAPTPKLTTTTNCTLFAPGCLDTSFGVDGLVTTAMTGGGGAKVSPLMQADGKIVVIGYTSGSTTGFDFALARYNADGSLDASFGSGGIVLDAITTGNDLVWAAALQPDGKILAAGYAGGETYMAVARFNPDGTLDPTFGSSGNVLITFTTHPKRASAAWALALQSDGKILLGGEPGRVVRLNANGSLDTSFGNQGSAAVSGVRALTTQRVVSGTGIEERILAAGGGGDFQVVRLTSNGSLDTSFGPTLNGMVSTDFCNAYDMGWSIAVDAANNIVVAGTARGDAFLDNFALARYTQNGILDLSFGDPVPGSSQRTGKTMVDFFGGNDGVRGLVIQADGKVVVGGNAERPDPSTTYYVYFVLARLSPDGTLDTSFGNGGVVATDFGTPASNVQATGWGVALQPSDAKIVMVGATVPDAAPTGHFALARYWP